MPNRPKRIITLSKTEVINKLRNPPSPDKGDWLLAVNPESMEARIVLRQEDGFVPDVEGHEDLFPLSMTLENEDGFLEGGDWLVAPTPERREHDGYDRSYTIKWINASAYQDPD